MILNFDEFSSWKQNHTRGKIGELNLKNFLPVECNYPEEFEIFSIVFIGVFDFVFFYTKNSLLQLFFDTATFKIKTILY